MPDAQADMKREQRQRAFADRMGYAEAALQSLPGDASFRRYSRLLGGAKAALLMDAPPPQENLAAYCKVNEHLARLGLRVPDIYARDDAEGLAIIEDFGGATFTRILNGQEEGPAEKRLYGAAARVLAALHSQPLAVDIDLAAYDSEKLLAEARLFVDWFAPAVTGQSVPPALQQAYLEAFRDCLHPVANVQKTLVLRDYHVDNIMWLDTEGNEGEITKESDIAACGLLDFQDALLGHPAYDLMSLLSDARREVSLEIQTYSLQVYSEALEGDARLKGADVGQFMKAMTLLSAQRQAKILGIFVRLFKRDHKPVYLTHIPRVIQLFSQALEGDEMGSLRTIVDATAPNWRHFKPEL